MKEFAEYLQFMYAVNCFMVTAKRLLAYAGSSAKRGVNKGQINVAFLQNMEFATH